MSNGDGSKPGKINQLQVIGGLVALAGGVAAVAVVAGGAMVAAPGSASSIASAAFGVIGSIVGAYFGVKIGSDGTLKAIQAHRLRQPRPRCSPRIYPRGKRKRS